jgi:hypothetical protein
MNINLKTYTLIPTEYSFSYFVKNLRKIIPNLNLKKVFVINSYRLCPHIHSPYSNKY